jgi:hypothetical protein
MTAEEAQMVLSKKATVQEIAESNTKIGLEQ